MHVVEHFGGGRHAGQKGMQQSQLLPLYVCGAGGCVCKSVTAASKQAATRKPSNNIQTASQPQPRSQCPSAAHACCWQNNTCVLKTNQCTKALGRVCRTHVPSHWVKDKQCNCATSSDDKVCSCEGRPSCQLNGVSEQLTRHSVSDYKQQR